MMFMHIEILNPSGKRLAIIDNYFSPKIRERINGEYTFRFTAILDGDKSEYITFGNLILIGNQLFNIVHHARTRGSDGSLTVLVDCEQVAYDLLEAKWDDGFVHAGTPADLLSLVLSGTEFTVGTVEPTDAISVDIAEATNGRALLLEIARLAGGELRFDKYEVSLLRRRGQMRGVQFRVGKNLKGITKDVDRRSGSVQTAYDIDVLELDQLPEFEGLEYFELGDTVRIVDPELGVDEEQRIVEYEYDPKQRLNSRVTIANFIESLPDMFTSIRKTTVVKDQFYNGTRIGPEIGFEAIRSDKKVRSILNATEGIRIQRGNGSGGAWSDLLYADTQGNLFLDGYIHARGGSIGGWTIESDRLSGSGIIEGGTITGSYFNGGIIHVETDVIVGNKIELTGAGGISRGIYFANVGAITYDMTTDTIELSSPNGVSISSSVLIVGTKDILSEINSKASAGAYTGVAGPYNGGIPLGTELMTADGGTVTWVGIPAHQHEQK